ncbi:hypothetical protein ACQPYH_18965 [Kribbella sp. CA-245084]|uniref:hypothetical protein n=1 Tax=Kribbella sp. CA-245084 TaxID=3239940 RepID=UPI003D906472
MRIGFDLLLVVIGVATGFLVARRGRGATGNGQVTTTSDAQGLGLAAPKLTSESSEAQVGQVPDEAGIVVAEVIAVLRHHLARLTPDCAPPDGDSSTNDNIFDLMILDGSRTEPLGTQKKVRVVEVDVLREQLPDGKIVVSALERRTCTITGTELDQAVAQHRSVAEFLLEKGASNIVDTTWPSITEQWKVTDPGRLDATADRIADLNAFLHQLLLGEPADAAANVLGLQPVIGSLASELPLPLDKQTSKLTLSIRVVGVVGGIVTGHPALSIACGKSLARQKVTELVTDSVLNIIEPSPEDPVADADPDRPMRGLPSDPSRHEVAADRTDPELNPRKDCSRLRPAQLRRSVNDPEAEPVAFTLGSSAVSDIYGRRDTTFINLDQPDSDHAQHRDKSAKNQRRSGKQPSRAEIGSGRRRHRRHRQVGR